MMYFKNLTSWQRKSIFLLIFLLACNKDDEIPIPDTTPPQVSITNPQDNALVSGTVTISAIATDAIGVEKVEFTINGDLKATVTESPYKFDWDTDNEDDGEHTITVTAFDIAKNFMSASITVLKDETPPQVNISSPTANSNVMGFVTITASVTDDNDTEKVEFLINDEVRGSDSNSPWQFEWNTKPDGKGTFFLKARAIDAAGNSSNSSTVSVNLKDVFDPEVEITSPGDGGEVAGMVEISVEASDNDEVDKVEFYVDGDLKDTDFSSPWEFNWNAGILPSDSYNLKVVAIDESDNEASDEIDVIVNNPDMNPPEVSISQPSNNASVSGNVLITATATDDNEVEKVEFYVNNQLRETDFSSPYQFDWNTEEDGKGSFTLKAKAFDVAGNATESDPISVNLIDIFDPEVSFIIPTNGAEVEGNVLVKVEAADNDEMEKVVLSYDGFEIGTDFNAPWEFNWDASSLSGNTGLMAIAHDVSGNTNTAQISVDVTQPDLTNPTVSITNPSDGSEVSGVIDITATASDNEGIEKVEFYINGSLEGTDTSSPYSYEWNTASLIGSQVDLVAKAYDLSGNSTTSNEVTVQVFAPPTEVTINIENKLLRAIIVTIDGVVKGSVAAQSSIQSVEFVSGTVLVEYEIVKVTTNEGNPVGDDMEGYFEINSSQNTWNLEVDNTLLNVSTGQTIFYFYPIIDNNSSMDLLMGVNMAIGPPIENRCNCVVKAGIETPIGYYLLYSNTDVRAYQGSDYNSAYYFWNFDEHFTVEEDTGKVTLVVN